jgi:6-phosphogluconate dehydrogenase
MKSKIGLIGLGVMGTNLGRNIADKGFKISVYNRTTEVMQKAVKSFGNENFEGFEELKDMVNSLEKPRKIILMVKAGPAVDAVIESLKPLLDKEDVIIDCGNSNYEKTARRFEDLRGDEIYFIGCGVSGGEEGALKGPSLMPGGDKEAWPQIKDIFETIAARDFDGNPCVTYIGDNAAGHYVKMVHNGIEYGIMQLMAEAYDLLKRIYKLPSPEIANIFEQYNEDRLESFLFEIAAEVLNKKDEYNDGYLIDFILDKAAQKGTGKWTAIDALDNGTALPTITEAVFARVVSSYKDLRKELSEKFKKQKIDRDLEKDIFVSVLEEALYAGMIICFAQGYHLIKMGAEENNWKINLSEISRIWQGGCIIRAKILKQMTEIFKQNNNIHLFESIDMNEPMESLRTIVSVGISAGIPVAGLSSAVTYFDSMTAENLPANFIQGLRDNFGAHKYERVDKTGKFHTEW